MKTFWEYIESYRTDTIRDMSQSAGKDYLAYSAFLDYLEENGFNVPERTRSKAFYNAHQSGIAEFMNVHDTKPARVRWMIRRDMPEVLLIDAFGTNTPWTQEDFLYRLQQRNVIGMVAETTNNTIVGFIVYSLSKNKMNIERLAVHPLYRNKGVGKMLIDTLKTKTSSHRRSTIDAPHPEEMQGFYGKQGFNTTPTRSSYTTTSDYNTESPGIM